MAQEFLLCFGQLCRSSNSGQIGIYPGFQESGERDSRCLLLGLAVIHSGDTAQYRYLTEARTHLTGSV
jgi:hypothetical protein